MSDQPTPQADRPPGWRNVATRFALGAALGLFVSAGTLFFADLKMWCVIAAGCALVSGFLTAVFGYDFWERVRNWWG